MTSPLCYRQAKQSDSEAVFRMAKAMATSFDVKKDCFEESFEEILNDTASTCLVVEHEEQLIAYLIGFDHRAFYANGRVSWLEEIFVEEEHRQKGIGRELMQAFESWANSRSSKLIGLATRRAADFYQALDYEESATFYRKVL